MSKAKNNVLISLLLLIFIGQATASTVILCSMPDTPSAQSLAKMDHSAHSMKKMNKAMSQKSTMNQNSAMSENTAKDESTVITQDCCSGDGSCSMASCFFLALSNGLQMQSTRLDQQMIDTFYSTAPSQPLYSLYRPPILS